jgi:cobalt-precorrin 5A hydrolase
MENDLGLARLFGPERLIGQAEFGAFEPYATLKEALRRDFGSYEGIVAIGAIGLYVRLIAPLLKNKFVDPAVVALGEDGRHSVSLLSGHLGRANFLASLVAKITGGEAVITTATDLNDQPALEVVAHDHGFKLEGLSRLPAVARALAEGRKVPLGDPKGLAREALAPYAESFTPFKDPSLPGLWVDYRAKAPKSCLIYRPLVLVVGIGAHKGISYDEIFELLNAVFAAKNLSLKSIRSLATIDRRATEPSFERLAATLTAPLYSYSPAELEAIKTPNPSAVVKKRIGVSSVCEAAALLAANPGRLLVEKQKSTKATLAVALIAYRSLAWAQARRPA